MRKLLFAGLALAIASQPALAQQSTTASTRGAAQANVQAAVPPATTTVSTSTSAATTVTRNNPGNLAAPPASPQNKTYPRCSRTVQDNCTNPGGR